MLDFLADGFDALVCDQIEGDQVVCWLYSVLFRLLPRQLLRHLHPVKLFTFLNVNHQRFVLAVLEAGELVQRSEFLDNDVVHFYLCVVREEDEVVCPFFELEAPNLQPLTLLEISLCKHEGKFVVFPVFL